MENVKKYILEQVSKKQLSQQDALKLLADINDNSAKTNEEIAVIGIACNLPEAESPNELWDNLLAERDCLNYMPKYLVDYFKPLENPYYTEFLGMKPTNIEAERLKARSSYIKNSDKFDAAFFGITPKEAQFIDPAQRVFMETAWSAIEDAGYGVDNVQGANIGVFVGKDHNNSGLYKNITEPDALSTVGAWESMMASRISYLFNFRGPAVVLDTACSSGLVAVHEACNSLKNGDCDMAIAGGISIGGSPVSSDDDEDDTDALKSVSSSDRTVRSFDKKSKGTVFGEGSVAFLLKPLKSALRAGDQVYAVIKASAINNDGASNSITAPNPAAQEDVIIEAWERAGISPETVSYVEAHGTGTLLGDPIEVNALNSAFRKYTNKKQFCGLGSIKANLGHLVAASGCAGMLKVILSMKNQTIPASINFEEPNPHINFFDSALFVVDRAMKWETNENPRRAGISSFGFSGTNVHVLLEDAPRVNVKKEVIKDKKHVLTMSAKSKTVLKTLVNNYVDFLERSNQVDLEDICYTANIGRGHFNYRASILFDDIADLKNKVNELSLKGLDDIECKQVHYGYYKVVSDKKQDRAPGEYTETEIKNINMNMEDIMSNIKGADISTYNTMLQQLCEYYVQGAMIDWKKLYEGSGCKKVSIPVYPFEKVAYWAEVKESKIVANAYDNNEKFNHPLVEHCIVKSVNQDIYSVRFSIEKHWILREHVITGKNIIPGTAYVELGREVCSRYIDGPIEFKDLVFLSPLSVNEGEEVEAQIIVTKEKKYVKFMVASEKVSEETGEKTWVTHVEGKAFGFDGVVSKSFEVATLQNNPTLRDIPMVLPTLEDKKATMTFGPRWHNVEHVYLAEDAMYVHARLADEFINDLKVFKYHTSMLDATVNAGIQATLDGVYLPFSFKSFKMLRPLTQEVISRAVKKEKEGFDQETLTYDVILEDENGEVLVEIEDYTVKKVNKMNGYIANSYYKVEWIEKELSAVKHSGASDNVVIFKDRSGLTNRMIEQLVDNNVITVEYGNAFKQLSENAYVVGASQEDYNQLTHAITKKPFSKIIHAGTVNFLSNDINLEGYHEEENKGVYSLLFLSKALMHEKLDNKVDFILISDNAQEVDQSEKTIKPLNASFLALGKSIISEFPKLGIRSLDIDEATSIESIINEIYSEQHQFRVAYRNNKRFIERLTKSVTTNAEATDVKVIDKGCSIITGGTGGLGLVVGKFLAMNDIKNICLISRKTVPDRSQWERILAEQTDIKMCKILNGIIDIEKLGARVSVESADICKKEEVKVIVDKLVNEHGSINGIVHCAGVAGDGFLINKPFEVFDGVIAPKVIGTKVLDEVTENLDIEFFLLFSSMTTLLGGPGQGDYTAANAYLDAFAQKRNKLNKMTMAVNWPAWSDTGMAVDYQVADMDTLFKSINSARALDILDEVFTGRMSNVIPSDINMEVLASISEQIPILVSDTLQKAIERQKKKQVKNKSGANRSYSLQDVAIMGKTANDYTETEAKVASIYASVLELDEIDIYESFNSMGGDSMITTEVLKVLNQYFDDKLDVSDMFSYQTVSEMAEYIDNLNNTEQVVAENKNVSNLIEQFESGEIEVDKMLEYFDEGK